MNSFWFWFLFWLSLAGAIAELRDWWWRRKWRKRQNNPLAWLEPSIWSKEVKDYYKHNPTRRKLY